MQSSLTFDGVISDMGPMKKINVPKRLFEMIKEFEDGPIIVTIKKKKNGT